MIISSRGPSTIPSVLLLLVCVVGAPTNAATYIVDRNAAADNADGSPGRPFRSIGAAVKLVEPGDRVLIRPGVYSEAVDLRASGTKEQPITIEAERPGTVFIRGADPLSGWTRLEGEHPVYWAHWAVDFFLGSRDKDGNRLRYFEKQGAPMALAELVIWQGRALRTVMTLAEMAPGTFHVDWDQDRLYLWLPDGSDPKTTEVLAGKRQRLLAPAPPKGGDWSHAYYYVIRNLTFQYAANHSNGFAQAAVITNTGWTVEDCVVEWNNAMGIAIRGQDVTIRRTVAQHNGHMGFVGTGQNVLVKDCVNRHNNWKHFSPNGSGSTKFTRMRSMRLENFESYNNVGPGIWFDVDNREIEIVNCMLYGNHGLRADYEAAGVFIEISPGPVRITGTTCYSNTGAGIQMAESRNVTIENNILVDNGEAIRLRDMVGRGDNHLADVVIRGNVFKDWRGAAVATGLGEWEANSAITKRITLEGNVYDSPAGKPCFIWDKRKFDTLGAARVALQVERGASVRKVSFDRPLVASRTIRSDAMPDLAKLIASAATGHVVQLPAHGRTPMQRSGDGWRCEIYDMHNYYVRLVIPTVGLRDAIASRIEEWPEVAPVLVKAKLMSVSPGSAEAVVIDVAR